jgi:hypothetical protein
MSIEPLCMSRVTFSMIMGDIYHIHGALIMLWGLVNTYCEPVTMSWENVNMSWELVNMTIEALCKSRETFSIILGTVNIP